MVSLGTGTLTVNDPLSSISGGSLATTGLCVGSSAAGSFTQSAGIVSLGEAPIAAGSLYLGYGSAGVGTYNLYGPGWLSTANSWGSEFVGYAGKGSFNQSGGTNNNVVSVYLGYYPASVGAYTLSQAGQLSADVIAVGNSGSGTFSQSGGTVAGTLYLGYALGGSGIYTLTAGCLSAIPYVGYSGTGTLLQSGGSVSGQALYVGYNPGSSGSYSLTETGYLSAGSANVVWGDEYIGYSSSGSFTQSGGTNIVQPDGDNSMVVLGYNPNSAGTYSLSGSGVHTIYGSLYLGYTGSSCGSYSMSGACTLSASNEYIGYSGSGSFTQTGGTNTTEVFLGNNAGGIGTYALGGSGLLSAFGLDVGFYGAGSFLQSGGTLAAAPSAYPLYVGYAPGASGTYTMTGGFLSNLSEVVSLTGTATFVPVGRRKRAS